MKEYTILAFIMAAVTVYADSRLGTNLLKKPLFWLFLAVIFGFKLLVNGFLTATNIVQYNPSFFLGIRLYSIPLEDFIFGFSMVTLAVAFWEYFQPKASK